MPYVKKGDVPFASVRRLLLGYDMDATELARVLDCSAGTARDRLKNPERLTLAEIDRINRFGHVPMDKLREAISR